MARHRAREARLLRSVPPYSWLLALLACTDAPDAPDDPGLPDDPGPVVDSPLDTYAPALTVTVDPVIGIRTLVARAEGAPDDALSWSWTADGAPTEHVGPTVPATALWPDQVWEVTVRADGSDARTASASVTVPRPAGGNILMVVLDDVGVDRFNAAAYAPTQARTPTIDALAASGVYFENAYATALCSPTRAALLTGRHGRRTGIGALVGATAMEELRPEAITIPEMLAAARAGTYTSFAVGKWHLSSVTSASGADAARIQGFGSYAGSLSNLTAAGDGYYRWAKTIDGVVVESTTYATTDTIDDAVTRIGAMPEPWFGYVALNAAHVPLDAPPPELTSVDVPQESPETERYLAVLEAADTELARLLASIPREVLDATTIVIVGDNGTSDAGTVPPFDPERGKHSVYEGGVHVPLVIKGPLVVRGGRSDALVHVVDLFATLADLAGAPLAPGDAGLSLALADGTDRTLDGVSLLPWLADPTLPSPRDVVYAEVFGPNGAPPYEEVDARTIRDARWKVIAETSYVTGVTTTQLFDLEAGVWDEGPDLLARGPLEAEQQAAYDRLLAALEAQLAAMPYEGR